jgi:dihydroorotate dehydrogenase
MITGLAEIRPMQWRYLINNFSGLATDFVESRSLTKAAGELGHDKKTIKGWCDGVEPLDGKDVGWLISLALRAGIDIGPFQTFAPIYDFAPMLSYEEKTHKAPPDLSWLTEVRFPPQIRSRFFDLELDTPLGLSSSPLVGDEKWAGLLLNLGFGLSSFKTQGASPRNTYHPPQIAFLAEAPDLLDYNPTIPPDVFVTIGRRTLQGPIPDPVNSMGGPSAGVIAWQETYERIRKHPRGHYVGISIIGDGKTQRDLVTDFENAISRAKEVHPPFIEINFSCPILEKGKDVWENAGIVREICEKARILLAGTDIILAIKLPYLLKPQMHRVLRATGKLIDVISFRNTLKVRPLVRHSDGKVHQAFPAREFGGLSGPSSFQLTRKGVKNLVAVRSELGQDFRIIANGGVCSTAHVVELQDSGADLVQACTAPMFDPLLAWKVRFDLKKLEPRISSAPALPLTETRNLVEVESLRNLYEAASELNRRFPTKPIGYDRLAETWNAWMEQRPIIPQARAHRQSPRTLAQWLRDLTS